MFAIIEKNFYIFGRGVQLVEREEEVCIFYEKLNIQETMIRNGDVSIQAMEEEIRLTSSFRFIYVCLLYGQLAVTVTSNVLNIS